jgi:uncharacterized protein (DUF362 family)
MSGLREAAERAGARVLLPSEAGTQSVRVSASLGNWPVFKPLVEADKILNVPVAKHHGSSRVTAGMKNWFGITLHERARFHVALDQTIAELAALVRPSLTIVDATRVLMRNGPARAATSRTCASTVRSPSARIRWPSTPGRRSCSGHARTR